MWCSQQSPFSFLMLYACQVWGYRLTNWVLSSFWLQRCTLLPDLQDWAWKQVRKLNPVFKTGFFFPLVYLRIESVQQFRWLFGHRNHEGLRNRWEVFWWELLTPARLLTESCGKAKKLCYLTMNRRERSVKHSGSDSDVLSEVKKKRKASTLNILFGCCWDVI